jgi:DNA-binding CsgD family transcriptional regulator
MRTDRGTLRPRHAMIAQAIVEESTPDEVRSTHRALGEALSGTASLLHRVGAARSAEDDPSLVSDLLGGAVTHLLAGDGEVSFELAYAAARLDPSRTVLAGISAMRIQRPDLVVRLEELTRLETRPMARLALESLAASGRQDLDMALEVMARATTADCDDETLLLLGYAAHEASRQAVAEGVYRAAASSATIRDALASRRAAMIEAGAGPQHVVEHSNLVGLLSMWVILGDLDPQDGRDTLARLAVLETELEPWPGTERTQAAMRAIRGSITYFSGSFDSAMSELGEAGANRDLLQPAYSRFQMLFHAGRWDEAFVVARQALARSMDQLHDVGRLRLVAAAAAIPAARLEPRTPDESIPRIRTGDDLLATTRSVAQAWVSVATDGEPAQTAELLDTAWRRGLAGVYAGLPTGVLRVRAHLAAGNEADAAGAAREITHGAYDRCAMAYITTHARALVERHPRRRVALFEEAAQALDAHLAEQPKVGLHLYRAVLAEDHARHVLAHDLSITERVRDDLRQALGLLRGTGAPAWRQRLEDLLVRCGGASSTARTQISPEGRRSSMRAVPETPAGLDTLTSRERQIAHLVADGQTNREIAAELFLSVRTVEFHISNALHKLGCDTRVDLRSLLRRYGGAHAVS